MRPLPLLLTLVALSPATMAAQSRWQALSAPTSQALSIDLRSLSAEGPIVSVVVRTPIGAGAFEVQRHDVRCTDYSIRLGPAQPYEPGARLRSPARPGSGSSWTRYSPRSDGRVTAEAICAVAKRQGLLRQDVSTLG